MAKRRKYGDAWKDIEIDEASNDAVFDKFFKPPPVVPVGLPDIGLPDSGKPKASPRVGCSFQVYLNRVNLYQVNLQARRAAA